jgi:hypothetical protein
LRGLGVAEGGFSLLLFRFSLISPFCIAGMIFFVWQIIGYNAGTSVYPIEKNLFFLRDDRLTTMV